MADSDFLLPDYMPDYDEQRFSSDSQLADLKVPPHSVQAEQSVLGGLMLDNNTWDQVADRLDENDFYRRDHRLIFRAIANLADNQQPFDVVTLAEVLEKNNWLNDAGGLAYLGAMAKDTPSAANVVAYADIVRERSVLRQLIQVGSQVADAAYHPKGRELSDLVEEAEQRIFRIADQKRRSGSGFKSIRSWLSRAVNRIDELFHVTSRVTGIGTGFADLDEMTSGLQRSDLVVVAGRPSMGKTTFAMNIAENVAIRERVPVAVFSMEMSGEQLAMRMLSSLGRIDQHRVRTGKLLDDEWPRMTSAVNLLGDTGLFIDDTPSLSPTEVRARCRRLAREHGDLGLVVLDYLQLMQVAGGAENRVNEISEISRSLKALAKEMNVPVIALSQLNRNLEQRTNKRPMPSDLRESGAIEQDADIIMFIYRDEVYNPDTPDKGKAELIIAKQRNGPTGTVNLTFQGQFTRFENFIASSDVGMPLPPPVGVDDDDEEEPPPRSYGFQLPPDADPSQSLIRKK
jgi:replicative DNA helicase